MMPTFPRSSLSFLTVSFPQYGWKAGLSDGACLDVAQLKPARGVRCSSSSLRPSFVHFVTASMAPLCVGPVGSIAHRHEAEYSAYPRGPRSQPGYSVPVGHRLIGPIRPDRKAAWHASDRFELAANAEPEGECQIVPAE